MFELIYASRAVVDLNDDQLQAFLGRSRCRNAEAAITGMLLHLHAPAAGEAIFVQLLEGPAAAVEQTFERIRGDELHHDVQVVRRAHKQVRSFEGWSMGLASMDSQAVLSALAGYPAAISADVATQLLHDPGLADVLIGAGTQPTPMPPET